MTDAGEGGRQVARARWTETKRGRRVVGTWQGAGWLLPKLLVDGRESRRSIGGRGADGETRGEDPQPQGVSAVEWPGLNALACWSKWLQPCGPTSGRVWWPSVEALPV